MAIKIGIIEDDESIVEMYTIKFDSEGFEVKSAFNGVDGLKLIESFQPDIILLDIMMPLMSGVDMMKELRTKDWGKAVKVIVLTNISEDEIPPEMNTYSVDRIIVKANHTPSSITQMIHDVLDGKPEEK